MFSKSKSASNFLLFFLIATIGATVGLNAEQDQTVSDFAASSTLTKPRLEIGPVAGLQFTNVPIPLSVVALDSSNAVMTHLSGAFELKALGEAVKKPGIVITEVVRENRDAVEFVNASTKTQNLNGWKVIFYDSQAASQKLTFSFTNEVLIAPGELFVLRESGFGPALTVKEFPINPAINWSWPNPVSASVLIQDAASNVVDFVIIGRRALDQLVFNGELIDAEWRGTNVAEPTQTTWSRQRIGSVDTSSAADWVAATPQIGQTNAGLNLPFRPGFARVRMEVDDAVVLTNGVWSSSARFLDVGTNVYLEAWMDRTLLSGGSEMFRIQSMPFLTVEGGSVTENDGLRTNVLAVELQVPRESGTLVTLTTDSTEISVPETVVIPFGETRVWVPVTVMDDALLDGTQMAKVIASAEGAESVPGFIAVVDNESALLTLSGTNIVSEGSAAMMEVMASEAPARDVLLEVSLDGPITLNSNYPVVLGADTRNVSFEIRAEDDDLLNASRPAAVSVNVANWVGTTNELTIADNEGREVSVLWPSAVNENAGVLTNKGTILLSGRTETNLTVELNVDPEGVILVPGSVTIPAGGRDASFNITVVDDAVANTNRVVVLDPIAEGFEHVSGTILGVNDDPADYVISVPSGALTAGVPINPTVRARGASGETLTNANFTVSLQLKNASGVPVAGPVDVTLKNGAGTAVITPGEVASGAYLFVEGRGATGESRKLNILDPEEQVVTGIYRDIVPRPGTTDLLASVASDATTNANQIVRVDSGTGNLETWLAADNLFNAENPHSGKMAVSPEGEYVFAITDGGGQVRAWKVEDRSLVQTFPMPLESARNIAVATGSAGTPFRLLIARGDWAAHLFAMDGSEQYHTVGFESAIGHPERPETFYAFSPYSVLEWQSTNTGVARAIELVRGPFQQAHVDMAVVDGRLFTIAGAVIDTESRAVVGELPMPAVLAAAVTGGRLTADLTRREVLRVYPDGGVTRIESFGAENLQLRNEAVLSTAANQLKRVWMVSSNRLALLNGGELRFVRWPSAGADAMVDLTVRAETASAVHRVGENWAWDITVTNAGASDATDVKLGLSIPAGLSVTSVSAVGGEAAVTTNGLVVHWPLINASSEVKVALALMPSVGGYVDLNFNVWANEDDIHDADNFVIERRFVGVGVAGESVTRLKLPVRDLAYDAVHEKIYALESNHGSATNTVLYEIEPATFLPTAIRTLPGYASHLRVSRDGKYLYSGVRGGRSAMRINLTEPGDVVEYVLGGENFILHSLEVSPLNSAAVVVAGTTEVEEEVLWETTIRLYEGTGPVGSEVKFYPSNGVYLGFLGMEPSGEGNFLRYPLNEMRRLRVDATGVVELGRYQRSPDMIVSFALVEGRMYTAFSDELRAASGKFLRGVPTESRNNHASVLYQAELDRLVYLQMRNGGTMSLQVFDRTSLASLGSVGIPAQGPADSMVDLGDGRMAIAFPNGEVIFVTSGLLGGMETETDLAVSMETVPSAPKLGEEVAVRVVVRNNGTNNPIFPGLAVELPFGFSYHFTNVAPRAARIASEYQSTTVLLWTNVVVGPGESVTNTIRGIFSEAGHLRLAAGIADRTADSVSSNNVTTLIVPISLDLQAGEYGVTSYQILDAGYDALRNRIIAATSATSEHEGLVIAIDPESGLVEETFDFGPNPTAMSLADDSDTIYVAVDGGTNIARGSLTSGEVEAVFSAHFPEVGEQRGVYWLGANPGRPDQVFVRADNGLAVFSDDQLLASTNYFYGRLEMYGPNGMVHSPEYAPHPINRVQFQDGGFVFSQGGPEFMNLIHAGAGLLVAGDGRIVDAETFAPVGQVSGIGAAVISGEENIIYNFGYANNTRTLRAFDVSTQSLLWDSSSLNFVQGGVEGIEAGAQFIAYRLQDDRLLIVRKKSAETNAPADLSLTLTTEGTWQAGSIGEWKVDLVNTGANGAAATRVDVRLPDGFRAVQVQGARVIADRTNHLSLEVGVLPAGGGSSVSVSAVANRAYTAAEVVASVRSSAVDANRANNTARLVHTVNSSPMPNLLETLDVPGSDLVYDREAKKLYIAGWTDDGIISSNLTVMDPFTGQPERTIECAGIPVRLAISPGCEFLYVALNGGARIERYKLPGLEFDLGFDIPVSAWFKVDMFVPEGMPETVVFSLHGAFTPSPAGVWVYDNDQPRAQGIGGGAHGVTLIEPGAAPDEMIAVGDTVAVQKVIRRYRLTAAGLEFVDEQAHSETPFALAAAGSTVLTWPSGLYDAATLDYRGALTNGFDAGAFLPEAMALSGDGIHAVLAGNTGMAVRIEGFRTDAMTLSGIAEIPLAGKVRALTLWEGDGIAVLAGNSLILGRLDLAAAPLQIRQFDADSVRVIFPAGAGRRWILQHATTPLGPWSEAAEAISAGGMQVVPVMNTSNTNSFFRVMLEPLLAPEE